MATLRNKKKLAALNKEKCEEHPRCNLAQNSNVPRSQENYIIQISEEIVWRVTKKLSQEFNRTQNRILGALSRLDDFLMNTLLQSHSGTAQQTSRNALSSIQGTIEDYCQSDPHPEAGIFHNQMTENSGPEDGHALVTGVHEEVTYCSPSTPSGKQKKTTLPVSRNSAVRIPLRRLKHTKFCWRFSSWQITAILQTFIVTSTESTKCQSHSPQWCPRLTGTLGSLSCLKVFSKRASKFLIGWQMMTASTIFILSWGGIRYKLLKTIMAQPERTWENS